MEMSLEIVLFIPQVLTFEVLSRGRSLKLFFAKMLLEKELCSGLSDTLGGRNPAKLGHSEGLVESLKQIRARGGSFVPGVGTVGGPSALAEHLSGDLAGVWLA